MSGLFLSQIQITCRRIALNCFFIFRKSDESRSPMIIWFVCMNVSKVSISEAKTSLRGFFKVIVRVSPSKNTHSIFKSDAVFTISAIISRSLSWFSLLRRKYRSLRQLTSARTAAISHLSPSDWYNWRLSYFFSGTGRRVDFYANFSHCKSLPLQSKQFCTIQSW